MNIWHQWLISDPDILTQICDVKSAIKQQSLTKQMNKTYIKQKIKQEKRQEVQENPFVSLSSDQYIPFDLNGVHLNTLIDFSLKIERIL